MKYLMLKSRHADSTIVIPQTRSCQSHYQGQIREYKLYFIYDFKEYDKIRNIINLTAYFYAKEIKE